VASPAGAVARKLYSAEELAQVPQIAIDGALGVASPLRHAGIEPGDTVLDLGCGYGIDTILAARHTGPAGRVIALDFLPAMLARTADAVAQAGLHNVDTLHADIEDIPCLTTALTRSSPTASSICARARHACSPNAAVCSGPAESCASPT